MQRMTEGHIKNTANSKSYRKPRLEQFGKLSELTQGGAYYSEIEDTSYYVSLQ